jgi:hypothetical protein
MNKIPCIYAIVRFSPFIETGEFANVGVIMLAAQQRFFDFKLLIGRYGRVTRFFEQLEPKVYRVTMRNLREELTRVQSLLRQHGFDRGTNPNDVEFAKSLFAEVIRHRETIVQFGEPGAVLAEDAQTTLEELFEYYVERNFVTKEYQETVLERGLGQWLAKARLRDRFVRHDVGDDEYHVAFPFVECNADRPVKAIKPLHLAHDQPSKILDHGGQWIWRVGQLARRNVLPARLLFAVQGPASDGGRTRAYNEVVGELAKSGAQVVPFVDKERVLAFAA